MTAVELVLSKGVTLTNEEENVFKKEYNCSSFRNFSQ